jgi:type IV pilus assembly protein PilW
MRRRRNAPGFSLVELLIAMAVSLLVIAGAMALLVSQQRIFQVSSADRALQETGRIALEELTSNLRMAGFGIDPDYAFDFGAQPRARQDRAPVTANPSAASTFPGCTAVSCRDSIAGSDEIAFRYRNPSFVRSLAAAPTSTTSITIAGPLRSPLYQGQILQVMCFGGDMLWAYVTVGSTVGITDGPTVDIPLAAGSGDQFPHQNAYLLNGCFSAVAPRNANATTFAAAAKVYKVDQFRYFVARYDGSGAVVTDITTTARPYLMLDQGLQDGGAAILSVVAPDVEDLQFAYVFPNSAAANQLIGATASTPISADETGIDLEPDATPPAFSDETGSAPRLTQHPGNIRAVAASIVVRSPAQDPLVFDSAIPATANRPTLTGPIGFRRQTFQTTAATRNLDARGPYFPTYSTSTTPGADYLNVGGG